jgi:hypothetical protein
VEILKVIVPAMVGPTAHLMSAAVWTLVRGASYTNTEPVLGNWSIGMYVNKLYIRYVQSVP